MKKFLIACAFALGLSVAMPAAKAAHWDVPEVTAVTISETVKNSDKPTIVLVVGENCEECKHVRGWIHMMLFKNGFGMHFNFVTWSASDSGTPEHLLPTV